MNTRSRSPLLLLPLLLLALVLPINGDSSSLVTNQSCPADVTVDEAQEPKNIGNGQPDKYGISQILDTYVHPLEGFSGVSVVAQVGMSTATAWFSFNNTCFVDVTPTAWGRMLARVEVVEDGAHYIQFQLRTAACSDACWTEKQGTGSELLSFHVEAHGPSRWTREEPPQGMCKVKKGLKPPTVSKDICKSPPQKTTTPSPAQQTPAVIVIILVVLAGVTVPVLVFIYIRRRRQRTEDAMPLPSKGAVNPTQEQLLLESSTSSSLPSTASVATLI